MDIADKKIDRDAVYRIIEDHWRTQLQSHSTSHAHMDALEDGLRYRLRQYSETLPESEHPELIRLVQMLADQFTEECERDARGMYRRLCGPLPGPDVKAHIVPGLVRTAAETAVRATVCQAIAALLGRR